MKISRCGVKVVSPVDGYVSWLCGFLDVDRKFPLFSAAPCSFPVRHALDFSVQLRRNYPIVKVVPLPDGSTT